MSRVVERIKRYAAGPYFKPEPSKHSFLASFPRSGNTWMRAVLFHYIYARAPESFAELQFGVPDEHIRVPARKVYTDKEAYPDAHIVKTHNRYQISRRYENVAYVIRDPRDVLPSYWQFMRRESREFKLSFDQFLNFSVNGAIWPCSWLEHVSSWKNAGSNQVPNIEFIRYEDLKAGHPDASAKLAVGLGLSNQDRIREIIDDYDVLRMKELERVSIQQGNKESLKGFVGKGFASEEMRRQAEQAIANSDCWLKAMEIFGYEV